MQFLYDLNYSLRLLRRTPFFTGTTLLVIVLGLSLFLTSIVFTNSLYNSPLPFPDGENYVSLKTFEDGSPFDNGINNHELLSYNYLRQHAESYTVLGAFEWGQFVVSDGDYARQFSGATIAIDLLTAAAVNPILGRVFNTEDAISGATAVALISHSVWLDYYGGDTEIIGKQSRIDGQARTIIGVMPENFSFPIDQDIWLPLPRSVAVIPGQGNPLSIVGILKQGATRTSATIELNILMAQLDREYPDSFDKRTELVVNYKAMLSLDNAYMKNLMNFITLIILALAVTNLSSLLFIRSSSRLQELAVRSSVGASPWQLAKQALLESLLLCLFGLALSLLASSIMLLLLSNQLSDMGLTPFWFNFKLNMQSVITAGIITLVIWLASGSAVAFKAYRNQPALVLAGANKGGEKQGRAVLTGLVVGVEMVVSCFLLICCGVTIYLVNQIAESDFGISVENYTVGNFALSGPSYATEQERLQYLEQLDLSLAAIPEVRATAITNAPPGVEGISGSYTIGVDSVLADNDAGNELPQQNTIWVSNNYFDTMNIGLLQGRYFDGADSADANSVVIISDQFALQHWPDGSAIGKSIRSVVNDEERVLTVVGIIPSLLQRTSSIMTTTPSFYRPLSQDTPSFFFLIASHQSSFSPQDLESKIRASGNSIDRDIPISDIRSLEDAIAAGFQIAAAIEVFVVVASAALFLAAIGIFGVIARTITLRTHEIGVRRALGSTNLKIFAKFANQGFYFVLAAAVLGGGPACLMIVAVVSFLTPELSVIAFLPAVYIGVVSIMALLVIGATYFPALRVLMMEPGDALRHD